MKAQEIRPGSPGGESAGSAALSRGPVAGREQSRAARGPGEDTARATDLEREADRLLETAGAFRRSTGILSRRRLLEVAERETGLEDLAETAAVELGAVDLWDEMDALAAWCGLTAMQKAAVSMWRLGEYTQEEIAHELGCSRRNVQRLLGRALRRIRRGAQEFPGTPRALFWEEVRWKSRLIYRKPSHGWRSGAGHAEERPPEDGDAERASHDSM